MNFRPGSNAFVFLVCTLLAATFWLIKAMEEQYTAEVKFPIQYQAFPDNKLLKDSLPPAATLKVQANGWQLLKLQARKRPYPLVVDLSDEGNNGQIRLEEQAFFKSGSVPDQLQVQEISPEKLTIEFDQALEKKLPVKLNGQFSYAPQHNLSDSIQVIPRQVRVKGPKTYLKNIEGVQTRSFRYTGIDKQLVRNVPLQAPDKPFVSYGQKAVKVIVPVEELTEKSLEAPLYFRNPYYRNQVTLFPAKATISFQAPLSRYQDIQASDFQLEVSGRPTDQNNPPDKLPVSISERPAFVYHVRVRPKRVNYLLAKDPLAAPN